jgi:hypothetical protein
MVGPPILLGLGKDLEISQRLSLASLSILEFQMPSRMPANNMPNTGEI